MRSLCLFLFLVVIASGQHVNAKAASGAIDAKTFRQLTKAQNYVAEEAFDEALAVLDKLSKKKRLSSYALAQVWNYQGFVYATKGQYTNAIQSYQQVLKQKDVPEALVLNARYVLGQLYFQSEAYQDSINSLLLWVDSVKSPSAVAFIMLAQAHYQLSKYDEALDFVIRAISRHETVSSQFSVPESWLQLKAALYFAKQDIKNTVATYEVLLRHYPNPQYLKQLAGLYGELGLNRKRLTTFDAAYEHGELGKGKEQLNLAYMFLEQGLPHKAAVVLEKAMANGDLKLNLKHQTLLAGLWSQSGQHDKAIPAYQKAAKLSGDGELFARLAGVFYQAIDYESCVQASTKASSKGGVLLPGQNFLLRGLSLVNLGKLEAALQAFRQAKEHKKSFKAAREWERYTLAQLEKEPTL
ncbi:hypothetical protein A9Q81_25385 [Gammaproteobacteria bacterium 42_54_T18]|nr:hypothetical protein A9Q81_25385 [Gammaproteobacteria bacterium 42_54_T18]